MDFLATPEFWVAVSFFLFLGVIFYFGVHRKLVGLDARADASRPSSKMQGGCAKAERCRHQAQTKDAVKETKAIVAQAAKRPRSSPRRRRCE
jgi:F-type H+-transporting ATPase subunit b